MSWIVGCDTGGTFTDVFALSDAGESRVAKVPSTPPRFDVGVVEGVEALGIEPAEVDTLFHGTTVTTNAVITKTGAPSAVVATLGFRDVLEIRRANREELYDILWARPRRSFRAVTGWRSTSGSTTPDTWSRRSTTNRSAQSRG